MKPIKNLLVFSSTPDVIADNFMVPVLMETIERLPARAKELGFDGLEFLPNPNDIADAATLLSAAKQAGANIGVINTGRFAPAGYAILHNDPDQRRKSIDIFKKFIDLAGTVGARVGLGLARGNSEIAAPEAELPPIMRDVFGEIAEHASAAETFVMLEPSDPGYVAVVRRVKEAADQVAAINSPGFSMMLDTYQLDQVEDSIDEGFEHAKGLATHIHLYDHKHWPPGVREPEHCLDWPLILKSMAKHNFSGSGSAVIVPSGDIDISTRKSTAFMRRVLMNGAA